ncbi:hypothetical protein GH714_032342 [Hevea brasiliensis]|uniref:K Homology domain-containing protein n=1 Tax=Hevea brasiliensis TaxID=3981 RepID=A0A6A6LIR6_HEVBR|nr:hypothetical protein GH714_032342 [Hevea brasiliensis]
MDGNKRKFFKKHQKNQFKRKGVNRRGKWTNSSHEESSGNSHRVDTVYRILCPSRKIGGVIGKGGSIVKALREETQAKITVADSVPGSDDRVIIIYSSPEKNSRNQNNDEDSTVENEQETMEPHCAAQDALMKVHERIVEEDLFGGMASDDDNENAIVTARLLVPNNMVGCLLGKRGDVIQKLRSETGASIRVLSADHLPSCAMSTDELVQAVDGGYGSQPTGFRPDGFNGATSGHGGEHSAEFSMKILCSAGKIGGVIGKGGSNVKLVQQETGASIHVEDASAESDERVIRVSACEAQWNPRSQTIDAILQLQNKTSEFSEKSTTTRLLVPSIKVGCILGQGGQVINEMRRRTQADIRVYSKDDKPKCASEDEELVQISGNIAVAKDALTEIASRLRVRTLRDANAGVEPGPVGPVHEYRPTQSLPGRGPPPSGIMGASSSGGYKPLRDGGQDYEPRNYPVPPAAIGYYNVNSALEASISNNGVSSVLGAGGISNVGEVAGTRVKLQDPPTGGPENVVELRRSSECLNAAQSFLQTFVACSGQNMNSQQVSYQNNMTAQQSSCQNVSAQGSTYQSMNVQHSPYQKMNMQQSPYSLTAKQGVYNTNASQATFQNISAQQGAYHFMRIFVP